MTKRRNLMRAEASKQPISRSSQLNRKITDGKRKEDSYSQVLSLQDVFSDSANQSGMQQKTLPAFGNEHGKITQLKGEKDHRLKRRPTGGRKRPEQNQKQAIKIQMHVTAKEYESSMINSDQQE